MKRYSKNQLQRYPIYLKYLRQLKEQGYTSVSSPLIAKELGYS
jgi:NADH/NAD ratio-sensing transcriptional regulator Rex